MRNDLVLAAGAGTRVEKPVGPAAEGRGRVGGHIGVTAGRVQVDAPGVDAVVDRGQGLAGMPQQHPQVPSPARRRAREELRRYGRDGREGVPEPAGSSSRIPAAMPSLMPGVIGLVPGSRPEPRPDHRHGSRRQGGLAADRRSRAGPGR